MNIRRAIAADITAMLDIERASPTAAHWTEGQYEQALQCGDLKSDHPAERLCLVAETAAEAASAVAAFLVARQLDHEWELENVVVAPASRRTGLGKRLLDRLLAEVRASSDDCVFLEVRESNTAARQLYEKAGFTQTGLRKAYYSNPPEDAVLYEWTNQS